MKGKQSFLKYIFLLLVATILSALASFYFAYDLNSKPVSSEFSFYIQGAVNRPGVYKINHAINIAEAIHLAYGLKDGADISNVDLAKIITNYQTVSIPARKAVNNTGTVIAAGPLSINVNQASATELEELPGIGAASSAKIIANRPYSDLEDFKRSTLTANQINNISNSISF